MSFLLLAYPKLIEEDYHWIQSIRKLYDHRYYNVVAPHFTIVFPVSNLDETALKKHIEKVCEEINPFQFTLCVTTIVKDPFSEYTDVFLVPDDGNSCIIKLHDKLYTGILSSELRLDIPFIPHIGIAASENPLEAKKIGDEINKESISIHGIIEELDFVEYEHPKVKTINKILLI